MHMRVASAVVAGVRAVDPDVHLVVIVVVHVVVVVVVGGGGVSRGRCAVRGFGPGWWCLGRAQGRGGRRAVPLRARRVSAYGPAIAPWSEV